MEKFLEKYRIPSARLQGWDYGSSGLYFITICTKDRICFFGDIKSNGDTHYRETEYRDKTQRIASLQITEIGEKAIQFWQDIPAFSPFVELDDFVLMPNHLHGILFLNKPDQNHWKTNKFGPQSQNLASVVRGYKAAVKKYATLNHLDFAWQPRYYDRIIRSEKELQNIRQYIENNPNKWDQNKNNPEGILM